MGSGSRRLALPAALPLLPVGAGLAIGAQFGDLAASLAKRRFGVTGSSGRISRHARLLDRLDEWLVVIPAVAVMIVSSGRSVLVWQ